MTPGAEARCDAASVKASEFYKNIMTTTTISSVGRFIGPRGSNIASLMSKMPGVFYKTLDPHHHHRYGGRNLLVYADSAEQLADALRATDPYRPVSADYYNEADEQDPDWEHEGESFDCMAYAACN
jgi:hypothetical protein